MDSYGDKFQAIPNHDNSRYRSVKELEVNKEDQEDKELEAIHEKIGIMLEDIARVGIIGEDDYYDMKGKLSLKSF